MPGTIKDERNTRLITEDGTEKRPTVKEKELPTDYRRPFTGCWSFAIVNGKKQWCKHGTRYRHEGKHHSV